MQRFSCGGGARARACHCQRQTRISRQVFEGIETASGPLPNFSVAGTAGIFVDLDQAVQFASDFGALPLRGIGLPWTPSDRPLVSPATTRSGWENADEVRDFLRAATASALGRGRRTGTLSERA